MNEEWRRLQGLYAAMSDDELLRLAEAKTGLTQVAQQAVDAEMGARGLAVESAPEAEALSEHSDALDDASLVELMTFQIATDAETALRALDDRGIPVRMEPAMRQMEEGGPKVKTNWLTIFVERARKAEAVGVLRERMGLFPVLAADERDDSGEDGGEDELLFTVGEFDVAADADIAKNALTDAGIWFKAGKVSQEASEDQAAFEGTVIEARLEDLEQAVAVVGAAFGEG